MTRELDIDPTANVITLVELFHAALEALRPGARYVITCTDEAIMVAFADHGGDLSNTTTRLSSGPLKAHPSNPGWTPPTWQRVKIRVSGGTGMVESEIPPVIWIPGPGPHDPSRRLPVRPEIEAKSEPIETKLHIVGANNPTPEET